MKRTMSSFLGRSRRFFLLKRPWRQGKVDGERGLSRESSGRRRHGEEEVLMLSVARERKNEREEESSGGSRRE
jgi:hypothetical protein